jgi:DNA-directed RNA polymerase specialized sigma24 family protein
LLEQRYGDGGSREDMATSLGIGEAGIKQALRRARTRMRLCMEGKLEAHARESRS